MSEANVGPQYDRWLAGKSVSGKLYGLMAGVQGAMLVNTPVYKLHEELQIEKSHRMLDVGCGSGSLLRLVESHVHFDTPPMGVDVSGEMLRKGRAEERALVLAQGAATALPFADESFDVISSSYLLKHLDDEALLAFLSELRRVLKFGGVAVLWEFSPTGSETLNQWNRWFVTRGVKECTFRNYHTLSAFALQAGFDWVNRARLRPFLFPPIPRTSMIVGKAPVGWSAAASGDIVPSP